MGERLTEKELDELRDQYRWDMIEMEEQEIEWLKSLLEDDEALKKSGLKKEKIPWMIANLEKAIGRHREWSAS